MFQSQTRSNLSAPWPQTLTGSFASPLIEPPDSATHKKYKLLNSSSFALQLIVAAYFLFYFIRNYNCGVAKVYDRMSSFVKWLAHCFHVRPKAWRFNLWFLPLFLLGKRLSVPHCASQQTDKYCSLRWTS